ncbi:MAG: hypothetical protein M3347_16640, partial [Armatimonadota bacterium]|nr:hypothetical protein [Armatimonadota bacterium]
MKARTAQAEKLKSSQKQKSSAKKVAPDYSKLSYQATVILGVAAIITGSYWSYVALHQGDSEAKAGLSSDGAILKEQKNSHSEKLSPDKLPKVEVEKIVATAGEMKIPFKLRRKSTNEIDLIPRNGARIVGNRPQVYA